MLWGYPKNVLASPMDQNLLIWTGRSEDWKTGRVVSLGKGCMVDMNILGHMGRVWQSICPSP